MIERRIEIQNISTNYTMSGRGNEILFLHGWKGNVGSWGYNMAELKEHFRCIAIDLPGFGETEYPESAWGIEQYSNFVDDFASELDLKNFALVGKSFGGRVAIHYAAKHPERLSSLVLVSAAGVEGKSLSTRVKIGFAKAGKSIFSILPEDWTKEARRALYSVYSLGQEDERKLEIKKRVTSEDLSGMLSEIKVPTLVVWGGQDEVLPIAVGEKIHRKIKGSEFITIEGGHFAHEQNPEAFNKVVINFLGRNANE